MPSRFLSDEQLARYGRYAGDPNEEQLARHFHLDTADRELVGRMRGAHNRLGFAVQLGTARFLGAFLDDPTQTPAAVITAMTRQLGGRRSRRAWKATAMAGSDGGTPRPFASSMGSVTSRRILLPGSG